MNFIPDFPLLLTFTGASLLLTLTPGPDMTLQIDRALKEGRLAAFAVMVGTNLGICVHSMLVAFGVSALIVASPIAFSVLKFAGAGYLFWLAIQAVFKGSSFNVGTSGQPHKRRSLLRGMMNGLLVNILNPKVILFFMTFLPQFVSSADPYVQAKLLFLGGYFIVIALPVGIGCILGAHYLSNWLQSHKSVLRAVDLLFGAVFSAFAVKILFAQAR